MSRLIDADVLIERLQEYADNDWNKSLGGIFIDCIDTCIDYVENQPTAYDVEKVVAEVDEFEIRCCDCQESCNTEGCLIERIKNVILKGEKE